MVKIRTKFPAERALAPHAAAGVPNLGQSGSVTA
jgi:hypothetical protein